MIKLNKLSFVLILLAIVFGGLFATNMNKWISETQNYGTILTPKESEITEFTFPENKTFDVKYNNMRSHMFFHENIYYALLVENKSTENYSIIEIRFNEDNTNIESTKLINTSLNKNLYLTGFAIYNDNFITIQRIEYRINSVSEDFLLVFNPEYGIIRNVSLPYPQWYEYNTTYTYPSDSYPNVYYPSTFYIDDDSLWILRYIGINKNDGSWIEFLTLLEFDINTVTLKTKQEIGEIITFHEEVYLGWISMFNDYQNVWFNANFDFYRENDNIKRSYLEYSIKNQQFGRTLLIDDSFPRTSLYDYDFNVTTIYNNNTLFASLESITNKPVYMLENGLLEVLVGDFSYDIGPRLIGFRIIPFSEKKFPLLDNIILGGSSLAFIGILVVNLLYLNKKEIIQ